MRIEISPGELVDKLTILEIKLEQLREPAKRENVAREYEILRNAYAQDVHETPAIAQVRGELKTVNETLWTIEDAIREHERRGDFGPDFVALARGVYRNNDRRSALKRRINELLGSALTEEKSYTPY